MTKITSGVNDKITRIVSQHIIVVAKFCILRFG